MTCTECGAPLDPTVTHVQHEAGWCDGDSGDGCECPEVCADCCTDPDCALRATETTMTDPEPLTDDEYMMTKGMVKAGGVPTTRQVRRLVATVVQVRKERDAAHAVIRHLLDYKTTVGITGDYWFIHGGSPKLDRREPMSAAEVDAIRRARATEADHG